MTAEAMANSKVAVLLLCFTFAAGAATGAGVHATFGGQRHPHGPPPPHGHGPRTGDSARRLPPPYEELGLSPDQRARAELIFEKHRPQLDAVFEELRPKLDQARQAMDTELRDVLTEEQRATFETIKARRGGFGGRHPGPPQP